MAAEPARAGDPGETWSFIGEPEQTVLIPNEPPSVRHPSRPVVWRRYFEPPLQPEWQALELGFGPRGIADARLILTFADGARLPQPFPKIARNRFRTLFRPMAPLTKLEIELTGTVTLAAPLHLALRTISTWEQRRALLGRALSVLRGDPRSFPWRLARVLVQLKRQGRSVIPPSPPTGSAQADYRVWRERFDDRDEDANLHLNPSSRLGRRVTFTVIADPGLTPEDDEALCRSLVAQVHQSWELFTPHSGSTDPRVHRLAAGAIGAALAAATGDFALLPRPGTRLRPQALAVFAAAADRWPAAELLYADDDDLVDAERANPRFKPAWSPTRLAASNYIGDLCCIEMRRLRRSCAAGGIHRGPHELLLAVTADLTPTAAVHIAQVLSHGRSPPKAAPIPATHSASEWPLVSLIVPTRDRADLLRLSVGSILAKTAYPHLEIIVVDNGSREPETLRLFEEWSGDVRIRVLPDPSPFNYAALNNRAVAAANGTMVGLINNDIEVLDPSWLDEMVGWALRPGVGCVGAKLFYPDGRLQHGGVVTGIAGAAGHRCKRAPRGAAGMLDELLTVNEVSAVTAACLLVRKAIYLDVGGLDEAAFAVAYNDVDFCLKVLRAGYRNLWTPFATLLHHESVSRGRDLSPATAERFNRENLALRLRWADRLLADPYYSPNLTLDAETGAIRTQ